MSGKYRDRLIWLKQTTNKETTFGQEEETFTNNGELWGSVEPLTAREQLAYGLRGVLVEVTIRIHNLPAVSFKDRLQDKASGTIYIIDGIKTWDNELELAAHQFRE
jgi:head-tail adaptor